MAKRKIATNRAPAKSRAARPILKSSKDHFVGEMVFNLGDQRQRLGCGSKLEHDPLFA
ncbi:hypothetical protein [Qingshengfaniella alkalisoli]|uniref:hypothetical protein n=1 Tax=Qingshengfaniella alkalisoli TaxID=2599296 RepID=UPI00143CE4D3|nr:hypothetical protein [Qingshengfaniella alkalisoli]